MNKHSRWIIAIQAILLVVLFWVLVFYGKDEFESYQEAADEEVETVNRVSAKEGISIVSLEANAQDNSGIKTATLTSMQHSEKTNSFGTVLQINELLDARAAWQKSLADLQRLRTNKGQAELQYQKLKKLNADEKMVSDKSVQETFTALKQHEAEIAAANAQIEINQKNNQLKWGEVLAQICNQANLTPQLAELVSGAQVLVSVTLPYNFTPNAQTSMQLNPVNSDGSVTINAQYLTPARQHDAANIGKTYLFTAPAENLRADMRVIVIGNAADNSAASGAVIPNEAVVWFGGKPWVYIKTKANQFVRKPISTENEVEQGWFNPQFKTDFPVVISGAQLLLSEEFKYQIKNENED